MKIKTLTILNLVLYLTACQNSTNTENTVSTPIIDRSHIPFSSSNGVVGERRLCPSSPFDAIVPIESLDPSPKDGSPKMTIEGIMEFIEKNEIKSITELLNTFPDHYRTNFTLVENTRATGQSNLKYPRIVLFGSDGHLLFNIGTLKSDPLYNELDVAQMHEDTGKWEFSVFDFKGDKPKLRRNPESCNECHGSENSRPVWGTNHFWPGMFGDNVAKGPQAEALDDGHLDRMIEIRDGKGNSTRFDFLIWSKERLHRGGKRRIANHNFKGDLFISNIAMGSATAQAAFTRMKLNYPERYEAFKEIILLLGYHSLDNSFLDKEQLKYIEKKLSKYGINNVNIDGVLQALGVDPNEAFSLATLHETEKPDTNWQMGRATLYDIIMLLVMDDLSKHNIKVRNMLVKQNVVEPVFRCPDTASTMQDIVDFKMFHLFYLKGEARYKVNWVYFPADAVHVNRTLMKPTINTLGTFLKSELL